MHRQFVHREEIGKLIAKTSGAITMIDDSHYNVGSTSVTTLTQSLQAKRPAFSRLIFIRNAMS